MTPRGASNRRTAALAVTGLVLTGASVAAVLALSGWCYSTLTAAGMKEFPDLAEMVLEPLPILGSGSLPTGLFVGAVSARGELKAVLAVSGFVFYVAWVLVFGLALAPLLFAKLTLGI
jgi:hypothetical protein